MGSELIPREKWLALLFLLRFAVLTEGNAYAHYYLDTDKLCSYNFKTKVIEVGRDDKSGAIIEDLKYFSTLSGKYTFSCRFRVESSSNMGMFAVIQNMNFRKNKDTGECIDYVQFRHSNAFQIIGLDITVKDTNMSWGEKHCGYIDASQLNLGEVDPTDGNNRVPHAYIDPKGKVDVKIHVANEPLTPEDNIDLKLVFTAYYICDYNRGNYKKCGPDGCIWHQYFNDGIANCPFVSCTDEGGCSIYYETGGIKPSAGLATKVMVGAVAGVFTMFIVFISFLWVFRHCTSCWRARPPQRPHTSPVLTVLHDMHPTAPPRSPSIDKDLPPTYESLFPDVITVSAQTPMHPR